MADTVFRLDPEIVIGRDTVNRVGALAGSQGSKILIATEQPLYENNHIERLIKIFKDTGHETILFDEIPAQSAADTAENAASLARGARCDMVVGFGGLKTQYIARLISILASSSLGLFDLLDGQKEESSFLPYVAIPTEWGDPFLFTDYFIAVDPRDRFVKLVKSPRRLCSTVIFDPSLSESLLSGKFASISAFDGLCTALETYCSTKSSFLSDAVMEQAIALYHKMIQTYGDNQPYDFLTNSVNAGFLLSLGASVSSAGIGTALAYALNGKFPVAKSWCATVLLPYIMEKLVAARPEKMAKAAALMGAPVEGASRSEAANLAVDTVRSHMGHLSVPSRLKDFDLVLDRLVPAADAARNLEFVAFSPWTITSEDAYDLLKQAF